ncbi:hypothetical protein QJQ45_011655 [Haematococcus lacustris]|nr:hypothetical protein QJQ45_011655 [Haematococcus lacustris]
MGGLLNRLPTGRSQSFSMTEEQNTTPPTESNAAAVPLAPMSTSPALLREDQILNAGRLLQVVDSPIATKRSFLERKGLTAEEIDEAFKRAPASAPAATVSTATPTGLITYQAQPSQPAASAMTPAPASSVSPQHVPQHVQQAEPLRWTQVVLGVGAVAASLYALKALLVPYAQDMYQAWHARARAQREAEAAQQAALLEAVQAMKACQEEVKSCSQAMVQLAQSMKEQAAQQAAARALEWGKTNTASSTELLRELSDIKALLSLRQGQLGQQGQGSTTTTAAPTTYPAHLPHSNGQPKGVAMAPLRPATAAGGALSVQRPGQATGYFHSASPDPGASKWGVAAGGQGEGGGQGQVMDQVQVPAPPGGWLGGYPAAAPPLAAWPQDQAQGSGSRAGGEEGDEPALSAGPAGAVDKAPYPPSFVEVMEMVARGQTPANVRTDIIDTPPDPSRALPPSSLAPQPKPWEAKSRSASRPFTPSYTTPYSPSSTTSAPTPAEPPALSDSTPSPRQLAGVQAEQQQPRAAGASGHYGAPAQGQGEAGVTFADGFNGVGSTAHTAKHLNPTAQPYAPPWAHTSAEVPSMHGMNGTANGEAHAAASTRLEFAVVPDPGTTFHAPSYPRAAAAPAPAAPVASDAGLLEPMVAGAAVGLPLPSMASQPSPPSAVLQSVSTGTWRPPPPPLPTLQHRATPTPDTQDPHPPAEARGWTQQHKKKTVSVLDVYNQLKQSNAVRDTPAQPSPAQPSPAQPSPAQPSPAQPSPAQPSPAQPSPAQPSPAQPSPAQPSPAQPSPAQPSPAQPSPAQPSPAQPSPAQPSPAQPSPAQPSPAQPSPAQPSPAQPSPAQPSPAQPSPAQPSPAQPSPAQPSPAQPSPAQPSPAQPSPAQPSPAQPSPAQPSPAQPSPAQPSPAQPSPAQPSPAQPSPAQPSPAQPSPAQPSPAQPSPAQPSPAQPSPAQPSPAQPSPAQPSPAQPSPAQPSPAQPSPAQPSPAQPSPAQPSPAQPSPAQPSPAQPSPAQPSPAQPSPAQPSPAQPSPAQPSPAQPSPAQPSPAQPSPAQPSPAQPSPAQPSPAQPSQPALPTETLQQPTQPEQPSFTPIASIEARQPFWKLQAAPQFPILAKAAQRLLSAHASTAAAERNWSMWGHTYHNALRNNFSVEAAKREVYLKANVPTTDSDDDTPTVQDTLIDIMN